MNHVPAARVVTLEQYDDPPERSQEPEFQAVQAAMRQKYSHKFNELRTIAVMVAGDAGDRGFTVEDLMDRAGGRQKYPKNLPGVVIGNLRSQHVLCVMSREKAEHPEAKGRWINRFKLNSGALRVQDPVPRAEMPIR
jgi:hypothetical protein